MISQKIIKAFLSLLGVGYMPYAPGTFGSIATLPIMYFISLAAPSIYIFGAGIIVLTLISSLLANYIQKKEHLHDPSWIVMDETLGMLVTWLYFYPTFNIQIAFVVLIVFRFFDIIKIYPASYFDKKVHHGFGTIMDDVISGLYAILAILLIEMTLAFL